MRVEGEVINQIVYASPLVLFLLIKCTNGAEREIKSEGYLPVKFIVKLWWQYRNCRFLTSEAQWRVKSKLLLSSIRWRVKTRLPYLGQQRWWEREYFSSSFGGWMRGQLPMSALTLSAAQLPQNPRRRVCRLCHMGAFVAADVAVGIWLFLHA